MLGLIVLFVILMFLAWLRFRADRRMAYYGKKIPGPPTLPIIGSASYLPSTGPELLEMGKRFQKIYGDVVKIWMGNQLMVILTDAADFEVILRDKQLIDKGGIYRFIHPWVGSGLITSKGNKWYKRRKAITPAFHFVIIEQFLDIINKNNDILIDCLKKTCGKGSVDVKPYISAYGLDVICETAMGSKINAQLNHSSSYFEAVNGICRIISKRCRKVLMYNDLMFKILGYKARQDKFLNVIHGLTKSVIKEKKEKYVSKKVGTQEDSGLRNKTVFLELLLAMQDQGNKAFESESDIIEEVNTFIFAGHHTITSAVCFTLNVLAKRPDLQDDLSEMKLLERVLKECLRLYPSAPFIGRQIAKDVMTPSGYLLPAGCLVILDIHRLHKSEKHFKNPLEFNPDNFLPDVAAKRHPHAYVPFSAGPRNCIGQKFAMMEMKSVLAQLVMNFKLEPVDESWDMILDPDIVLLSLNGHKLCLKQRTT